MHLLTMVDSHDTHELNEAYHPLLDGCDLTWFFGSVFIGNQVHESNFGAANRHGSSSLSSMNLPFHISL